MDSIIALDIGTAFCSAAVFRNGKVEILPIEGKSRCPSFVTCQEGFSFEGQSAKEHWKKHPTGTIYSSFRLLGCLSNQPWLTNTFSTAPFKIDLNGERVKIVAGEGDSAVVTSPEEVCSRMIGHVMKEIGDGAEKTQEEEEGEEQGTQRVALCVPTCTSFAKRQAIKAVAEANGLKVTRFVNSTTAAALKHCLDQELFHKETRTMVVVDMGAGNTSVSVITVGEGKTKVEASSGTDTFGGDFIDEKVYDYLAEKIKTSHGINIANLPSVNVDLRSSIKLCKHISSYHTACNVGIQPQKGVYYTEPVTQETLKKLCGDHVERTVLAHLKNVIVAVKIQPRKVDEVLLIGGSSNIPLVRSVIRKTFPRADISSDQSTGKDKTAETMAVSGAALQAALLSFEAPDGLKNVEIEETLNFNLGFQLPGGSLQAIFEPLSPLPADNEFSVCQSQIEESLSINVYEGAGFFQGATFLATLNLADIIRSDDILGDHLVKLKFEMNENGFFFVTAYHLKTGQILCLNIGDIKQSETTRVLHSSKNGEDQEMIRRKTLNRVKKIASNLKRKASDFKLELFVDNEDKLKIQQASADFEAWQVANPDADLDTVERKRQTLEKICGGIVMQRIIAKKRLL